MPPIGKAIGNNLPNLFLVISPGKSFYNSTTGQLLDPPPPPYNTLQDAQADKAVTWNWGNLYELDPPYPPFSHCSLLPFAQRAGESGVGCLWHIPH